MTYDTMVETINFWVDITIESQLYNSDFIKFYNMNYIK